MAEIGLAFSGGGVRSAAFCSGVLRRLLQKNVKIDYLSCVSGGGYTGSAYMDWKYRHGKTDDKSWHQEFFNHMRERIGLICNWQKPCQAIGQSFAILGVILFGSLIVPVLTWISIAYPLAFVVDFLFGEILRGGSSCPEVVQSKNITLKECEQGQPSLDVIYFHQAELFSTPLFLALLCFLLKIFIPKAKRLLELLSTFCLACFALLFFPWFIRDFLNYLPTWLKFAIFVPLFLAWISSPLTRSSATLMTGIYVSSFAIYWRVYKESVFGWGYTERSFELLLGMATLLQWILPLLGIIQQRLMHVYLRWIIQRAFFYPKTLGVCGCAGITWRNLCLHCPNCCEPTKTGIRYSQALTLDDLDDLTPTYIGCITSNQWRRTASPREDHYEVLTMSPQDITRLDRSQDEEELRGKLEPMDVYLSEVTATSASAINYHMGRMQGDEAAFKDLKVLLGLSSGAAIVTDERQEEDRPFWLQILPWLIELIRGGPLAAAFVFYLTTGDAELLNAGFLVFFGGAFLFCCLALVPTGNKNPGRLERIARWFTVNVSSVNFFRNALQVTNQGPNPPAVLYLSDGGHIENLGILPLLKLRLPKIVCVEGGRTISDEDYAGCLLRALDMARIKLRCSFTGMDGQDITEDIRDKFVERSPGSQPRNYRFKVQYYEKNVKSDGKTKVGEGEVLFIAPRHPDKGVKTSQYITWEKALRDIDMDLDARFWGVGPKVSAEEVDRLTFFCCESCHGNTCRGCSEAMCGTFPQHSTYNMFFTPAMFSAYHREGYRASMEAKVEEFLADEDQPITSEKLFV